MYALAASILISIILLLVSKHQKWQAFWTTLAVAVVVVTLFIGYVEYDDHLGAQKSKDSRVSSPASKTPSK